MMRTVLTVILGYVVTVVVVMLGIFAAWQFFGPTRAFRGGTTTASTVWAVTNLLIGFVAATVGGLVAAKVGKHPGGRPVKALAGLVLVLGLLLAVAQLWKEVEPLPEGKTIETLTFAEAGGVAISPTWYNFTIPPVGAVGVLLGGGLVARRDDA